MKKWFLLLGIISFMTSCDYLMPEKEYSLTIVLKDATGLKYGADVVCKGLDVGQLSNVHMDGNEVLGTMKFKNEFKIPKGSEFYTTIANVFGRKKIEVVLAEGDEYYKEGDKVFVADGTLHQINDILEDINISIDSAFGGALDSVVQVLKKLEDKDLKIVPKIPGDDKSK